MEEEFFSKGRITGIKKISNSKNIIPGWAAFKIGREIETENHKKSKKASQDTIERMNIHNEIKKLMGYGLSKKETLERLTDKFQESKYTKYFDSWVEDQYEKINNKQVKEEECQER